MNWGDQKEVRIGRGMEMFQTKFISVFRQFSCGCAACGLVTCLLWWCGMCTLPPSTGWAAPPGESSRVVVGASGQKMIYLQRKMI